MTSGGSSSETAGSTAQTPGPYAAEIKAAAKKAHSQFARDILTDGVITRAEYLTAMNRFKSCMENHGLTVKLRDQNGYYQVVVITKSENINGNVETNCEKGTIFYIAGLYEQMVKDPQRQGRFAQIYACLKRVGLIPSGYTEQDYISDYKAVLVTVTYRSGVALNTPTPRTPNYPFDTDDPRYGACVNNPENPRIQPSPTG